MEDTDLSNLTPQEAREYVLAFITTMKQTTRRRQELSQEIETWRGRLKLAEERGAPDLAAKATEVLHGLEERDSTLAAEEEELRGKVARLKENLKRVEITGQRLVDTDLLQAQLDMVVGEETAAAQATDKALGDAQAQAALDELKKKLGQGGAS